MDFSERLVEEYRIDANKLLARVCRWVALLMVLICALNFAKVFNIKSDWIYVMVALAFVISLMPTVLFDILKINKNWAQYLVLTSIVVMVGAMYVFLSYHSVIMLVFPIFCSCLYSDRKWIVYVTIISVPMIIISHLLALYLRIVPDEPLITLHGTIVYGIIPRLIQFIAIGAIAATITKKMRGLVESLVIKNNDLYRNQQELVMSLSELVEAQSQETGQHVKRVCEYTKILCEGMGYDKEETWKVSIASMMHDVGKLLVPSEIIEKPGKLTNDEFEIIKKHVDYGKRMLDNSPGELMQLSAIIAYEHHERWDGTGYKHKKGEEINKYARCTSVADVFDALVSWRPYKRPWTAKEAYDEIVSQSGKMFDPDVVEVFKNNFDKFEKVMKEYPDA